MIITLSSCFCQTFCVFIGGWLKKSLIARCLKQKYVCNFMHLAFPFSVLKCCDTIYLIIIEIILWLKSNMYSCTQLNEKNLYLFWILENITVILCFFCFFFMLRMALSVPSAVWVCGHEQKALVSHNAMDICLFFSLKDRSLFVFCLHPCYGPRP